MSKKNNEEFLTIVKAFEVFRREMQLVSDQAYSMIVDLSFQASTNARTHYNFDQDEVVMLNNIDLHTDGEIIYSVPFQDKEKRFFQKDAELIAVTTEYDDGSEQRSNLGEIAEKLFKEAFEETEIDSFNALKEKVVGNTKLWLAINAGSDYIEAQESKLSRGERYVTLLGFGKY